MTVERLESHYLSWWYWARACLLPAALVLLCVLLTARLIAQNGRDLNEIAAIAGFFTFYFAAVRGGHIYMIRTVHNQLKKEYAGIYPKRIQALPQTMKMRQIGSALARIKAELARRH